MNYRDNSGPLDDYETQYPKRKFFDWLLASGRWPLVTVVTSFPGVEVPEQLKKSESGSCALRYGMDMPTPIPDFIIDDNKISATLVFGSTTFRCVVPWGAVACIQAEPGMGVMWPVMVAVDDKGEPPKDKDKPKRHLSSVS